MLIINISGLMLIALIVWWFWLYNPKAEKISEKDLLVLVENGVYHPAHILLEGGKPHDISFLRKDSSPCAEMLIIPALEISETLPLNKAITIHIPPLTEGNYPFHCQMRMYLGELIVGTRD